MINYKQTIKNFSKILPTADLDMLFKLMDAIVEEKLLNFPTTTSTPYSTHNANKTNAEI